MSRRPIPIPKKQATKVLTDKAITVLTKSSSIGGKDTQLWHKNFLETSPSAKMDRTKFAEVFKQFHPKESEEAVTKAFSTADRNSDGTVDFNEFLFCTAVRNRALSVDERLGLIFELWDVSNDGQLDVNELTNLISAMYDRARITDCQGEKSPANRAKAIIKQLDVSGDQKLSQEEFLKGLKADQVIADLLDPK